MGCWRKLNMVNQLNHWVLGGLISEAPRGRCHPCGRYCCNGCKKGQGHGNWCERVIVAQVPGYDMNGDGTPDQMQTVRWF